MGSVGGAVESQEGFANILANIINVANMSIVTVEQIHSVMNAPIDTAFIQEVQNQAAQGELNPAPQGDVDPVPPVDVPVVWKTDNLEAFAGTGVERFRQEAAGTVAMLNAVNRTQARIAARAARTNIFSLDVDEVQDCLQTIQDQIQEIESNRLDVGADRENVELGQLQAHLNQAIRLQDSMNQTIQNMNVGNVGSAVLQQSKTKESVQKSSGDSGGGQRSPSMVVTDTVKKVKGIIEGEGPIKIFSPESIAEFIQNCANGYDAQLYAELQLLTVLAGRPDEDYATQIRCEISADQTNAVEGINGIQDGVNEVEITAVLRKEALLADFDTIMEKINEIEARGIYRGEVMAGAAAEFAAYFKDTDAIEVMLDALADYAMSMEKGLSELNASKMRTYAANFGKVMSGDYTAMSSGGLNFSEAQKAVIQGEATREQMISVLGEGSLGMSSDMQAAVVITQVVDKAGAGMYETMSNTPEGQMMQMTNMGGKMMGDAGGQLYPYVLLFVDAIVQNWGTIQTVIDSIVVGLECLLGFLSWLMEGALNFAQVVIGNWGLFSPIIYGIIGALAVYGTYLGIIKGLELASAAVKGVMAVWEGIRAAAIWATTGATWAEVTAQNGLNGAMYACPVVWLIILIIALIAIFYAVVAAINKFAGTSISATGIICGVFMVAAAFIGNLLVALINAGIDVFVMFRNFIASFANFFGNVFNDPVGAIARLFFDLADNVLGILESLASTIDTIFGSDFAGTVSGWRNSLGGWVDETFGQGEEFVEKLDASSMHLERYEYGEAWDAGYSFGEGIDESIKNFDPSSLFKPNELPSTEDYADKLLDGGIGTGVENIDENTGAMAESMEITGEELKYLRDIAEQEAINRFTTAEINIEQTNHNTIRNGMDLDGVVSGLENAIGEAVEIMTEGVHE